MDRGPLVVVLIAAGGGAALGLLGFETLPPWVVLIAGLLLMFVVGGTLLGRSAQRAGSRRVTPESLTRTEVGGALSVMFGALTTIVGVAWWVAAALT